MVVLAYFLGGLSFHRAFFLEWMITKLLPGPHLPTSFGRRYVEKAELLWEMSKCTGMWLSNSEKWLSTSIRWWVLWCEIASSCYYASQTFHFLVLLQTVGQKKKEYLKLEVNSVVTAVFFFFLVKASIVLSQHKNSFYLQMVLACFLLVSTQILFLVPD